jgi:hypothetical protein
MDTNKKSVIITAIIFIFLSICIIAINVSSFMYYKKLKYIERYEVEIKVGRDIHYLNFDIKEKE